MQALLDFLLGMASRIYYFYRDLWWDALDVIHNAWDWIVTQAGRARIAAEAFAQGLINYVWDFVNGLEDRVYRWLDFLYDGLNNLRANLTDWIDSALEDVLDWINTTIGNVWDYVQEQITNVSDYIEGVREDLVAWFSNSLDEISSTLYEWTPFLARLVVALGGGVLERLIDLAGRKYEQLTAILDDPAAWIIDLLAPKTLRLLDYLIGTALGTTNRELPPPPKWSK